MRPILDQGEAFGGGGPAERASGLRSGCPVDAVDDGEDLALSVVRAFLVVALDDGDSGVGTDAEVQADLVCVRELHDESEPVEPVRVYVKDRRFVDASEPGMLVEDMDRDVGRGNGEVRGINDDLD